MKKYHKYEWIIGASGGAFILIVSLVTYLMVQQVLSLNNLYTRLRLRLEAQNDQMTQLTKSLTDLQSNQDNLNLQVQSFMLSENFIYLYKDIPSHVRNNKTRTDIILELPQGAQVLNEEPGDPDATDGTFNIIREDGNEYRMVINHGGPPPCGFNERLPVCSYTDEKLTTAEFPITLRIWQKENKVVAINVPKISIDEYYPKHFIVYKTKPNSIFSSQEVDFWKSLLINHIRVIQKFF